MNTDQASLIHSEICNSKQQGGDESALTLLALTLLAPFNQPDGVNPGNTAGTSTWHFFKNEEEKKTLDERKGWILV